MRRVLGSVLVALALSACGDPEPTGPLDASTPPIDADAPPSDAPADAAADAPADAPDDAPADAPDAFVPCSESTYHADCDGDGFAALGAETTRSCDAPTAPPATCGDAPDASWTLDDPLDGEDCDDADGGAVTIAQHWPDCDGDGLAPTGSAAVRSCGAPTAPHESCSPGEIGGWTTRGPGGTSGDCDDHDRDVRECDAK